MKPNGADTAVFFDYGTDDNYGTTVTAANSPLLATGSTNQLAGQEITGLALNTTYHFRARAINSVDEAIGPDRTFTTTPSADTPNVTTKVPDNITPTAARSGGTIESQGASSVTAKGVCWAITQAPDLDDDCADGSGSGIGPFLADITGLSPATLYYVRAYATNSAGTAYGNEVPFRTQEVLAYVDPADVCGSNTPCFDTINFAIASVDSGTEIRILQGTYAEDVVLGTEKNVKLSGGWATTGYAGKDQPTIIQTLTAEKGSVEIEDIIVQTP